MEDITNDAGTPADSTTSPVDEHQAPVVDARDEMLAALRAEIEALSNPPAAEPEPEPADPRDRAIAELRAELAALRSTPEGAAAEMSKALAALTAEVERMKAGKGLVPVPVQTNPDPVLYTMRLACGDLADAQHPHATHHHCDAHGTVPVKDVWPINHEMYAAA